MPYIYNTFIKPLTSTDISINILDNKGVLQYTINAYSILNVQVLNNLLKISTPGLTDILLDFSTPTEARMALQLIQTEIATLRNKPPLLMDDKIVNYIESLTFSQGLTGYLPANNPVFNGLLSGGNISLEPNQYILFNGNSDTNWRMGYNMGAFELNTVSTPLTIVTGDGETDGFAIGGPDGVSYFEIKTSNNTFWFRGNISLNEGIIDTNNNIGSSGDFLSSTGENVKWVTPNYIGLTSAFNNEIVVGDSTQGIKSFSNNTYDGKSQIITSTFSNFEYSQVFTGSGLDDGEYYINGFNPINNIPFIATINATNSTILELLTDNVSFNPGDTIYGATISPYIDGTGVINSGTYTYDGPAMGQTIQPLNSGIIESIVGKFAIRGTTSNVFAYIYDGPNGNLITKSDNSVLGIWPGTEFNNIIGTWSFVDSNINLISGYTYYVQFLADNETGLFFETDTNLYPRGNFYHGPSGSVVEQSGYSLDFILTYGGRDSITASVIGFGIDINNYAWVVTNNTQFIDFETISNQTGLTSSLYKNQGQYDTYQIIGSSFSSILPTGVTFSIEDGLLFGVQSMTGHTIGNSWNLYTDTIYSDPFSIKGPTGIDLFKVSNEEIIFNNIGYDFPIIQGESNSVLVNDGNGGLTWSILGKSHTIFNPQNNSIVNLVNNQINIINLSATFSNLTIVAPTASNSDTIIITINNSITSISWPINFVSPQLNNIGRSTSTWVYDENSSNWY